jgi:hypothetical protein
MIGQTNLLKLVMKIGPEMPGADGSGTEEPSFIGWKIVHAQRAKSPAY